MSEQEQPVLTLVPKQFLEEIRNDIKAILNANNIDNSEQLPDFIPESKAKVLLGKKGTWFFNLRKEGKIEYYKVGAKVMYATKDIMNLIESNKKGG